MTYNYNVTELGMTEQHLQKTINPLDKAAVFQKEPRPFGDHWKQRSAAARYLAKHVKAAIEETMPGPAKAMAYLQSLADEATAAERPLRWTTPAGIPWINRYHVPKYRTIKLWLDDLATYYRTLRVVGEKRKIDKTKTRNGVTANFVHACDAAHLMLTVNAAVSVAEGITSIATVHDSFGCLAPQAERFRQIIREQFVKMYDAHDVLQEVLDRAREDLGEHANKLPTKPAKGTLNIEGVRVAEYAFS
jgi:DNA-directed RNA polymerase